MRISPAKRRLSGPARTLMTSLRWRAQQGGCVGSRDDVARLIEIFLKRIFLFISLFFLPSVYDPAGWQTLDRLQNSAKLCCFYLCIIWMFETFLSAGFTTGCKVCTILKDWTVKMGPNPDCFIELCLCFDLIIIYKRAGRCRCGD